jgi:outer membrane protein TolC
MKRGYRSSFAGPWRPSTTGEMKTYFPGLRYERDGQNGVREGRVQQELLVTALEDRKRLAYVRYTGGVDTLLNALDADRDLFDAQLALSQIRLNEVLSVVQLYKALGGGWQQ